MRKIALLTLGLLSLSATQAQTWNLTGNAGTNPSTNFIGTTDAQPLRFRVGNTLSGEINQSTGVTSLGYLAGQYSGSGYATAIGYQSLRFLGNQNTAVGARAMGNNGGAGSYNVAVGYSVLYNNSGSDNTGMGYGALTSNTTGYNNAAYGSDAMRSNTYGNFNTSMGDAALMRTTGSQYNTAIGYTAGYRYDLGYNNTILGANCDGSFAGQYNIVAIGQGVICPDNSTARIGNSATWSIGGWAGWSNFSDGRYKKDVKEDVKGLDFIMKLRPVTYRLDVTGLSQRLGENHGEEWGPQMKTAIADKEKVVLTGFVAQEVEKAASDADFTFSGVDKPRTEQGLYALRYAEFVVPLVKAMQEQQAMIKDLQSQVQTLQQQADVAIVLRESGSTDKISAFPDPMVSSMTVSVSTQSAGPGTLSIFDAGGKLIKQMSITIQPGVNNFSLTLPNAASGYYTLSLDWGNNLHKKISFVKAN